MAFSETLDVTTWDGYKGQVRYRALADGAGQDQTDTILADISALAPAPTHVTVERIQAVVNGDFTVTLEFENSTDQVIDVFTGQSDVSNPYIVDYTGGPNKGVANTSAGGTGDIVYTTSGIASGDELNIIVDFHKKN
jgi:hypothetical protein